MKNPSRTAAPGDLLLHPAILCSIGLLILNDHVLKAMWPGWWTGKTSDFAGALFFPVLVQAAIELGQWSVGRYSGPSRRGIVVGAWITAALFLLTELSTDGAAAVAVVASWLDPRDVAHTLTADPTDLLALTMPAFALSWASRRAQTSRPSPECAA